MAHITLYHSDNLPILQSLPSEFVDLIYIDPPFNTGRKQKRTQLKTVLSKDGEGDRTGFQGKRYKSVQMGTKAYDDSFENFEEFIKPRINEAYRILKPFGSLFFHIDYREAHYCKIWLDQLFGRECFQNEIIWSYDYGARSKKKWSCKHDTIFWYSKHPTNYTFNYDQIDRIPYMAPKLVGKEKAKRGKTPTDVWWHTIVSPMGKEKTGYPTQKPRGIIDRIIKVHSNENETVCDFFAGSGTIGESAFALNRSSLLVDKNPQAIEVMLERFKKKEIENITLYGEPQTL